MNNNALLEIFTEHLPARFVIPALEQMQKAAAEILAKHNLEYGSLRTYGTFRRLVLEIKELAPKAQDIQKEIKGPPAKLLKDSQGNYTQQAAGFAERNGIAPAKLVTVETDKGPFIYAKIKVKGESAKKLLPVIFTEIINSINFPKNMVWEDSGFKFARPIRSLIGLYGDKVVPFEIAGVKSGRNTYPISSFGRKPIKINSPEVYAETLRNQYPPILVEQEDRRKALINAVNSIADKLGYKADLDEDLITETISFTEHPVPLAGDMDISFLTLPKDLVTTSFKKQLRMFPVLDDKGNLQPHFIAVRDGVSDNADEVRSGFKNVMTARLTDAVFFYNNDIKTGLSAMKEKLASVNFIDGMGTMLDKTNRVEKLALKLSSAFPNYETDAETAADIKQAAAFCYADLTSGVVYEFPELQGYMGSVYARKAGFSEAAAQAMAEFYLPLTASSALPGTIEGAVISLAGKFDTLAANFAMGQIPTGSEDPYALRRNAMGAVRIMLDKNCALPLQKVIDLAAELLPATENSQISALYGFMWQRAANILEQEGIAADVIAAVENLKDRSLPDILTIAQALNAARAGDTLSAVGEAAKRVGNILKKADFKGGDINPALFNNEAEKILAARYGEVKKALGESLAGDITQSSCGAAFARLAEFKDPLESFFEKVMVNDSDENIRNNRLALLWQINNILTLSIADLSKLQKRG